MTVRLRPKTFNAPVYFEQDNLNTMTVTYAIRQSKQQLHWDQIGDGKKRKIQQNASEFQEGNFMNHRLW